MSETEHIRAFIRPHPRLSGQSQIDRAQEHGCGAIYVVGQDIDDWPEYVAQIADGDECCIARLVLLVSHKVRPPRKRRDELRRAVKAIEDAGGVILELETGRSSADPGQRDDMIADAWESIAAGGLVPKRGKTLGRPKREFDPADVAAAKVVWESRKLKTWAAVEANLPPGISRWDAYRLFGRRG